MKARILFIASLFATANLMSQSHVDAFRFSQHTIGGTARSIAMGGAFGALGGDFSTLSTNPAGLGVYRSSEFTFTPEFYYSNAETRYFNNEEQEGKFNFNIGNIGYVGNYSNEGSVLSAVNFGVGYNRIANFHSNQFYSGVNDFTSYADVMAERSNDVETGYVENIFGPWLFQDSEVLLYNEVDNMYVINNDSIDGYFDDNGYFIPTLQEVNITESGRVNEWTFSVGLNFNHILYFGGTLGVLGVRYKKEQSWSEFDGDFQDFQYFDYNTVNSTIGTGYTGKIGMIVRPIASLRLGVAAHLPVYYNLKNEITSNIYSRYVGTVYPSDEDFIPVDIGEVKYTVITPAKFIGSIAGVFGKLLIVSSDIEYMNYSKMRIESDDFTTSGENIENKIIKDEYKSAINAKIGTELRIENTYFRLGFGYYGSPYAKGENAKNENSDSYQLSYSGGLGFRDQNFFFDISYQLLAYEYRNMLYDAIVPVENGYDYYKSMANITKNNHRVTMTIGFKF